MTTLRQLAGERSFLLVGDSKLISYPNLRAMIRAGVTFIAPASKTYVGAEVLAAQDWAAAAPVDYVAERDRAKPAERRGGYRVREDTMTLAPKGKRRRDPALILRRVLVWSSADQDAARASRAKKLDRARDDLARLTRDLGSRHDPDADAVAARVRVIGRDRKVTAYLRAEVGTGTDGKPTLSWHFDQATLDADTATDGWYALLTNLDPAEVSAAEVLRRYKGQEVVERRYGNFKGPLAVAPMFLKSNRRIQALITVICLALGVFCLVERAVRLAIAPATTLHGLWMGRPAKPTWRLIFTALARLRLAPASGHDPPGIHTPPPLQAKLQELLNVDPTRPRWVS
jgi:transposase